MTIKKIRRNDRCPCGSGLKYKHCCLRKERTARRERQRRNEVRVKGELGRIWSLRRPLPAEGGGV